MGRVLPTADVVYAVAQLGGQLSGGEIAYMTGAGRPKAAADTIDSECWKLSFDTPNDRAV